MTAIDHKGSWGNGASRDAALLSRETVYPAALSLVALIALAGLLMRLAAARGDLWLDEIWSLDLVSYLRWPGEVFWAVPHDNNHPLNSLWLALLGPDRSPMLYRLPAVLFGTATIMAAARYGWRTNPAAAVAAAALTAFAYPLVLYGSEARGYAGLILAVVVAVDLWTRMMEQREAGATLADLRGRRWALAAIALFGAASHFTMLGALAILGAATVLRRWWPCGPLAAIDEAVTLFRPLLILLLPLVFAIAAGALAKGGFVIGGVSPFAPGDFIQGYGELIAALLGIRGFAPAAWALFVTAVLVGTGFAFRLIDKRAIPLALAALVILPAALFIARVGNTGFPRYFLVAGLILPLLLAESVGRLWPRGPGARVGAVLLVLLPCLGQIPDIARLLKTHRGAPAAAMAFVPPGAAIRLNGEKPFPVGLVAARFAASGRHALVSANAPFPCDQPPDWLFHDGAEDEAAPLRIADGGSSCPTAYTLVERFPTTAWSGRAYSVYRRDR